MNKIKYYKLKDGAYILFRKNKVNKGVSLNIGFSTGSLNNFSGTYGIAHFSEHLLFQGIKYIYGNNIFDLMKNKVNYLNACTSSSSIDMIFEEESKNLYKCFEIAHNAYLKNKLNKEDMNNEKTVVLNEKDMYVARNIQPYYDALGVELNEKNCFVRTFGNNDSLMPLTIKNIEKFYNDNFNSSNFHIFVDGNVSARKIIKLYKKYFQPYLKLGKKAKTISQLQTSKIMFKKGQHIFKYNSSIDKHSLYLSIPLKPSKTNFELMNIFAFILSNPNGAIYNNIITKNNLLSSYRASVMPYKDCYYIKLEFESEYKKVNKIINEFAKGIADLQNVGVEKCVLEKLIKNINKRKLVAESRPPYSLNLDDLFEYQELKNKKLKKSLFKKFDYNLLNNFIFNNIKFDSAVLVSYVSKDCKEIYGDKELNKLFNINKK